MHLFISYETFEGFLEARKSGAPVFIAVTPDKSRPGNWLLHLSQVRDDGLVAYWRSPTAWLHPKVENQDRHAYYGELQKRANTLCECTAAYLSGAGVAVEKALIGVPATVELLEGTCSSLRYDESTGRFVFDQAHAKQ